MSRDRTGIVMEIKDKKACIMTSNGEFIYVKVKGKKPDVGEVYTGSSSIVVPNFRNAAIAASLVLFLLTGSAAYAYSKPVTSIILSNPSVKVEVNRWNRIIKTIPLNDEAKKMLSSVKVNNKSLNDGLSLIVDQVGKNKNINNSQKNEQPDTNKDNKPNNNESNKIVVYIDGKKSNSNVNLSKFENHASKNNFNVEIASSKDNKQNSSKENKTDDEKTKKIQGTKKNVNNGKGKSSQRQKNNNGNEEENQKGKNNQDNNGKNQNNGNQKSDQGKSQDAGND